MSDLLTNFTVDDIQRAIVNDVYCVRPNDIAIPNVASGFFTHIEVDLLVESSYGTLTDYEIKRSWSDFFADFKKKHYHDDVRLQNLCYVLPDKMACPKLAEWCAEHYKEFKRTFAIRFYNSEGDRCKLIDYHTRVKNAYGFDTSGPDRPEYMVDGYITKEMHTYINQHDPLWHYRRHMFLEERVKLYSLALRWKMGRLHDDTDPQSEAKNNLINDMVAALKKIRGCDRPAGDCATCCTRYGCNERERRMLIKNAEEITK